MNKELDPRGRYDAVMAAEGLVQVEPVQQTRSSRETWICRTQNVATSRHQYEHPAWKRCPLPTLEINELQPISGPLHDLGSDGGVNAGNPQPTYPTASFQLAAVLISNSADTEGSSQFAQASR